MPTQSHSLVDGTLVAGIKGIEARCTCGWISSGHFSSFAASAAFVDHQALVAKLGETPGTIPQVKVPETVIMDKERERISRLLSEMRGELDDLTFSTSNQQQCLKIDAEKRTLLWLAIVQLELTHIKEPIKLVS